MTRSPFVVRPRRADDLPALTSILAEQQAASGYPHRWPLPFPVEDFVVRAQEVGGWVAEDEGGVLGHVAVLAAGGTGHEEAWVVGTGVPVERLGVVAVLFVGTAARGRGVGRALLDEAVASCRAARLRPVLDVVPHHESARALYRSAGWVEVGRDSAAWQPEGDEPLVLMTLPDPTDEAGLEASLTTRSARRP